jgi:hypothetical protein
MKKVIVTTTINAPTSALEKYIALPDWEMIVVGDTKTPHEAFRDLAQKHPHVTYLDPETQEKKYKIISDTIGWKSIQRRNIGFLEAFERGADVVATVDDDNIPLPGWGDVVAGTDVPVRIYEPAERVFDPLAATEHTAIWHRGYPIQLLLNKNAIKDIGVEKRRVLVQANLWNGDPDVDAVCRIALHPEVSFDSIQDWYGSAKISPFNSQNTIVHREVLPRYAMLPHIGRMDDIWGGYVLQHFFPRSVAYGPATVVQERNEHDLSKDLEAEVIGYRHTLALLNDLGNFMHYLPEPTKKFWKEWCAYFGQSEE